MMFIRLSFILGVVILHNSFLLTWAIPQDNDMPNTEASPEVVSNSDYCNLDNLPPIPLASRQFKASFFVAAMNNPEIVELTSIANANTEDVADSAAEALCKALYSVNCSVAEPTCELLKGVVKHIFPVIGPLKYFDLNAEVLGVLLYGMGCLTEDNASDLANGLLDSSLAAINDTGMSTVEGKVASLIKGVIDWLTGLGISICCVVPQMVGTFHSLGCRKYL